MTTITLWDEGSDVYVTAIGHADLPSGKDLTAIRICAIVTSVLTTLWLVTFANGEWKGPEGGEIRLRIADALSRRDSLVYAFLALFAFSGSYSDYLVINNESQLLRGWVEDFERSMPEGWTCPMLS